MDHKALLDGARRVDGGCTPGQVTLHRRHDGVFVLVLCGEADNPENRWTLQFCRAIHCAFDAVEAELTADPKGAPAALLTVSHSPKFFSNGIDLAWVRSPNKPRDEFKEWNDLLMPAFARPILLPIPTICAIGGHAFGAGLMFALGHDYRLQQAGRGFLCAIEIEIGLKTPGPEFSLFRHAIPASAFYETVLHAKRWSAEESLRAGVVHAIAPADAFLYEAAKIGTQHAKLGANRDCMGYTKLEVQGHVAREILHHTFPGGRQRSSAQLSPGLMKHVDVVVVQDTLKTTWAVAHNSRL